MPGKTISHYEILEKLVADETGDIYKAQDRRHNRLVSIKAVPRAGGGDADTEPRRRFIREAQAASGLKHPNIITIFEIFSKDDTEFVVMEFVAGKTLAELIPETGLSVAKALHYGVQIADAVQTAHASGIVHGGLRPDNILVTLQGQVKILDFGMAKLTEGALTVEGSIVGTSYRSPEQAQGKCADVRSDIFSFGRLLYEMLTGKKAFAAHSAVSTLAAIMWDEVTPIGQIVKGVAPELEQIIDRALRKDPEERWQHIGYMHSALAQQKFESAGIIFEFLPEPLPAAAATPSRFWNVAALVMLSMLLSLLLVGAGAWVNDHRPWTRTPAPVSPVATAAEPDAPRPARKKAAAGDVLTNKTVIGMVKANMAAPLIVSRIRSSKTNFNLSAPEIVRLGQAGVPEQVMDAMHNPKPSAKSNRQP